MTAEAIVYGALQSLANGNVFPDVAPPNSVAPWITYQSVGGQDFATLAGSTPTLRNSRMQITCWANTRIGCAALMEQAFLALVNPAVLAVPIGAPVSSFEKDTLLYGSTLDFSITYSG